MTLGLKDTTAYTFIKPINDIKKVDEILIVRDFPGPRFSKVTYYCPPNRISKLPIIKLFFKIWLMLLLCIRKRPTIIIAINLYMYGVVSFYVGKIFKIPTIVSIIAGKREVSRLGTLVELFLLGLLKNYDGITVTGKGTKDFLIDKKIDRSKIFVLPNIIETKNYGRRPEANKKYDLVTIGRIKKVKRLEIFIQIITKLKKNQPGIKAAIAGKGPEIDNLKKLCNELNVKENVKFLGYINDVEEFYNTGMVYILTSEREGFPLALLEAMSCGIPSIVSNVGDISDVIVNGENGFIINDYRDVNGYVDAISKLLKDDSLYKKVQKNALKVRNKYSVKNASRIWKKIISKLQLS